MNTETAPTVETSAECRIYVACLASYNNGVLHGRWIDVDGRDATELREEVEAMLRQSPYPNVTVQCPACEGGEQEGCATCRGVGKLPSAEEFAIHDHEGFGRMVGEYTSLQDVVAIAEGLTGGNALAFRWLVEDRGFSVSEAADRAEDVRIYQAEGVYDLAADYAQELFEETRSSEERGRLNQWPFTCIDWEAAGRELTIGGDVELAELGGERFLVTNASEF